VRKMGGGHHAPPTEGLDGIVRKYLPQDYQVGYLSICNQADFVTVDRLCWVLWDFIPLFICLES
jgi:hypothetical protein